MIAAILMNYTPASLTIQRGPRAESSRSPNAVEPLQGRISRRSTNSFWSTPAEFETRLGFDRAALGIKDRKIAVSAYAVAVLRALLWLVRTASRLASRLDPSAIAAMSESAGSRSAHALRA
jgi:hypothetical protein